jgi:hypothetical protein
MSPGCSYQGMRKHAPPEDLLESPAVSFASRYGGRSTATGPKSFCRTTVLRKLKRHRMHLPNGRTA